MLIYPSILPQNGQAFNLASNRAYNLQGDLVISVEYAISGNINTEAGLSFYLLSDSTSLVGGVSGCDLCYSGYYNDTQKGISTGIIGLGFDSTGCFGLSATGRDGYDETYIVPNSIAVRGSKTNYYAMSSVGNYYRAVSSYNLIGNSFEARYLRFRVGNVARTLYLDYKLHVDDCYAPVAAIDIGEYIDISSFYRIGFGFTTPVSSSNVNSVANFYFKTVHVEGLVTTLSGLVPLLEVWENIAPMWPDLTESWSL
jgi:hypothetical protein